MPHAPWDENKTRACVTEVEIERNWGTKEPIPAGADTHPTELSGAGTSLAAATA